VIILGATPIQESASHDEPSNRSRPGRDDVVPRDHRPVLGSGDVLYSERPVMRHFALASLAWRGQNGTR
jgi:hypothetical protein